MMKFTSKLFGRGGKKIVRPFDRTKELDMNSTNRLNTRPQAGTVAWLNDCIERSKTEIFTEMVDVSPGLASEILRRNSDNRKIKPVKSQHYARDMVSGDWVLNGENIIFAKTGELNDGQHRMQAVIDANTVVTFPFLFGVERNSRITVDQGAARTAGDYLSMDGIVNGNRCAGICRIVKAYEHTRGRSLSGMKAFTNAMIIERVKQDPDIRDAALFSARVARYSRGIINPATIGACFYILSEIDAFDANEYMLAVVVGENIARGHPAFAVRVNLSNMQHNNQAIKMESILRGWTHYRRGRELYQIKSVGTFPELV